MSVQDLRHRLESLREQLDAQPGLAPREREDIRALIDKIEDRLRTGDTTSHSGLTHGVSLSAERFEAEHPGVAGALRGIGVALANIGI